jgi:retron-type reverse transcriptase
LGVPTVLDRVIQQALAQVLNPLFEGGFSEHSYGFRENRNAHQAVREVEACWKEGRRHAVDCDLKSFFDTVPHDRLMRQVREKVRDRKVLGLIRRNRGHRVQDVIDELRRYATGWLNYFGISHTDTAVVELADWLRRRVRLYYWKS